MSERVYLKCVSTENDYLTLGKVYVANVDPTGGYYFYVDDGQRAFQWKLSGAHGEFEIVRESPESPKLTPRSLGCFREVADVIGENAAERELQKVIDSWETVWDEPDKDLIQGFTWETSPQGSDFWFEICEGNIPEGYQTNHHQISTNGGNGSDNSKPKSAPEFGDLIHIGGQPRVYLSKWGHAGAHKITSEDGQVCIVDLEEIDEYRPNKSQELRNRILERYHGRSLDNAWDTAICRVDMSVGDLVDFVVENIESEAGE